MFQTRSQKVMASITNFGNPMLAKKCLGLNHINNNTRLHHLLESRRIVCWEYLRPMLKVLPTHYVEHVVR